MGFLEHLGELRVRVRRAALAYVAGVAVAYLFAEPLFVLLARPLVRSWVQAGLGTPVLHFKSPVEPLFVYIKISLIGGLFLASPAIFWQLWRFVAPGLYARERKAVIPFVGASALCFVGGAAFGYFVVFPRLFGFLLGFARLNMGDLSRLLSGAVTLAVDTPLSLQPTLMMEEYLGLAAKTLIIFGLCFELPVFLLLLGVIGIVNHKQLLRIGRYAVIAIFLVAAIVTPDPTATTQIMLAIPLVALYFLGVLLVYLFGRKPEPRAA